MDPLVDIYAFLRAVRSDDVEAVHASLDRGFPVDARHEEVQMTPLMQAAAAGAAGVARLLVERGADPLAKTLRGEETLVMLCRGRFDRPEIARLLLGGGADPRQRDQHGIPVLSLTASRGNAGVVRALVEAGCPPDGEPGAGRIPLHAAAADGHTAAVKALLECGARVDHREGEGMTALMEALVAHHVECAHALVAAGASVKVRARISGVVGPLLVLHLALGALDELVYDGRRSPPPDEGLVLALIERGAAGVLSGEERADALKWARVAKLRRAAAKLT